MQIYSNKIRAEQKSVIPSTTELYRFYDPAVCSNPVLKRKLESTWLKVTVVVFHRLPICLYFVIRCKTHSQYIYYTHCLFHQRNWLPGQFKVFDLWFLKFSLWCDCKLIFQFWSQNYFFLMLFFYIKIFVLI